MRKFLLLISAWLSLNATAQIESTRYGFTGTANNAEAGEYSKHPLPADFAMQGFGSIVIYDNSEGFILNEDTKWLKPTWSKYTNGELRIALWYTATYTDENENIQTVTIPNREEWVPGWQYWVNNNDPFDLTTTGKSENGDGTGIADLLAKDATITITRIEIHNFDQKDENSEWMDYGLTTLNIAGADVQELSGEGFNQKWYGGEFTVKNEGAQPCNIATFTIPEQYRGKYVRIDFGTEPDHDWGLNLAFDRGDGGWRSIDIYEKKIGLSRYYKIPEEATTMNPQIWKNANDGTPWTINVAGFYLTTGINMGSVYTDEYFPLDNNKMKNLWGENSVLDNDTKTITFGDNFCQFGWEMPSSTSFTDYEKLVVVANPQANDTYVLLHMNVDNNDYTVYNQDGTEPCFKRGIDHITVDLSTSILKVNDTQINMSDVTSVKDFRLWYGWGESLILPLANVFLTNVEPNWDAPETRATQKDNYGTVCLPYPAICTNGLVYKVTGKNEAGDKIYVEPYNGILVAGMPYIYKSIGDGVKFYQIEDETARAASPSNDNGLIGCWGEASANESCYALNKDNKWYKMDVAVNFSNRAYLDLSRVPVINEPVVANVAMRIILENTTGIRQIEVDQENDNAVYTLSGVRINNTDNLKKGIYIRQGKKFIVK